jgi:hypothetical protein
VIDDKEAARINNVTPEEQQRGVLRLVHAKSNYSPKVADLWLKRGEYGGFTSFIPEFKDAADDYTGFLISLRRWAVAHPEPFTKREVTKNQIDVIFRGKVTQNAANKFFDQAVSEGDVAVTDAVSRGGGAKYLMRETPSAP